MVIKRWDVEYMEIQMVDRWAGELFKSEPLRRIVFQVWAATMNSCSSLSSNDRWFFTSKPLRGIVVQVWAVMADNCSSMTWRSKISRWESVDMLKTWNYGWLTGERVNCSSLSCYSGYFFKFEPLRQIVLQVWATTIDGYSRLSHYDR